MDQLNFHKQKLYALIIAAIALVALLLPWLNANFLGASRSWNGFRSWGILSLLGVLAVAFLSFTGNKQDDYSAEYRKYVMFAFGAIALGAFLFWLRKNSVSGGMPDELLKTGIGLWICLVAGLAGLGLMNGLIKIETNKPVG
ncbi:MAG: hypothetical protein ACXWV0_02095 [Flavisolibacter sp.]